VTNAWVQVDEETGRKGNYGFVEFACGNDRKFDAGLKLDKFNEPIRKARKEFAAIAAGVVNNYYFKSEVFEEEKPAHILAATFDTVAKAAKAVVKVEEKEKIVWKLNKLDGT